MPASTNPRILIVDDEQTNLILLKRFLTHAHYTDVTITTDPTAVPGLIAEGKFDVLLLDLHMPGMDGFEVMRQLHEEIHERPLPVLVLTADITEETKLEALELGAFYFLTKPFDRKELVLRVDNLVTTRMRDTHLRAEKANLESRLHQIETEAEAAKLETLQQLARAAECRDEDTFEHVTRVGELVERIALELKVPVCGAAVLRQAAPLHDIGKLGIPDAILLKPGKLTDEEFETMKTHTVIGSHILSGGTSPLMKVAEEIAISHHERWDGNGYPHKLAGPEIPLCGRITAVADVFDALTHERPYKRAWSEEEAIACIQEGSGKQFDPAVVRAFLRVVGTGVVADLKERLAS